MAGDRQPFRFGVLAPHAADAAAWRRTAREAERLGYSSLLAPDHLDAEWGPLVSLTIAAEATESLVVGPLMLAVDFRTPVVLFKELATLAQIAAGRLEIGLGAGWHSLDYSRAGLQLDPAAVRIDRLDEAATILQGLWANPHVSHNGKHYTVVEAVGRPTPPAAARWTMGGGGRRILELAARRADIVSLSARMSSGHRDATFGRSATVAHFDRRTAWLREAAGSRLADIELQCYVFVCAITADAERYASRVLGPMFGLTPEEALASPLALVGTVDEICDRLVRHRDRLGIGYWIVPAAQMTGFAEVVARLAGT